MSEIINKHLQREIDREVMIKKATEKVRLNSAERRLLARRKIEKLKEERELEKSISDYE